MVNLKSQELSSFKSYSMKLYLFTLLLFFCVLATKISAQDYLISFTGSGESSTVSSVKVENLTQGTWLEMIGSDNLHLIGTVTGIESLKTEDPGKISFYPNPSDEMTRMQFSLPVPGKTLITVYDLSGREVAQNQDFLSDGFHTYLIQGTGKGIYFVGIQSGRYVTRGRFLSMNSVGGTVRIMSETTAGRLSSSQEVADYKSEKTEIIMQYNTGDRLKFTGISGDFSSIITDVPTKSKSITFNFLSCSDGDGNNYPVVQIGSQLWMAENLKTTSYNNGNPIAYPGSDNLAWQTNTTGAYAWYNNEIEYKQVYGALYNWYAVNTDMLCPAGWHVPNAEEWTLLVELNGGVDFAGGKLKESGTAHWETPNTGATNETGYTALPGGYRYDYGSYDLVDRYGYWWSDYEISADYAQLRNMTYDDAGIFHWGKPKNYGHSVRCIKDQPKLEEAYPGIKGELFNFTIDGETITVEKINGKYIFQGDIILTEEQFNSGSEKGAGINSFIIRWPCTIFYEINDNLVHKKNEINSAISYFKENTQVDFVLREHEETNYIEFIWDPSGCSSNIGMIGGRQEIRIADWGNTGTIIHEIGHAVGLIHEHSRQDRNSNVIINYSNIENGEEYNFELIKTRYMTQSFDFNSLMLYPSFAFSKNGLPTITRLDGSTYEANRQSLSVNDKNVVNSIYTIGTVQDIDGNIYYTINIDKQIWMAQNLMTTKLNDGTPIPQYQSEESWNLNWDKPAFCYIAGHPYSGFNESDYREVFGTLYNWHTVNTGKLCPSGWHVPNNDEWLQLVKFLDPELYPDTINYVPGYSVSCIAGSKLKKSGAVSWEEWEFGDWDVGQEGTNEVCFYALPGGQRTSLITFDYLNKKGFWWSSDFYEGIDAWYWSIADKGILKSYSSPWAGMSVRCIKDQP